MMKSVHERGEWIGEFQELTKDNKPLIVQCRATLIRDENRQPKSLLLINTDITKRKQLEEQFLRSQRLESLGVLISGIAHDLNNALAPVLLGIDMLRASPDEKENILRTMQSSAKRGADMVIETAGVPQAVPEALDMMRLGGLLVSFVGELRWPLAKL